MKDEIIYHTFFSLCLSLAAPPPTIQPVETEQLNNDGCERVAMLTCTATVVENFAVLPNITWLDSENQEVQSGSNDVMLGEPGELIFNDVTQNNMGDYKCLTLSLSIMTAASPVVRVGLGTGRVND